MPSLAELTQAVTEYQSRRITLDSFADWFRANSRTMFGEESDVLEASLAIEAAFSRFEVEGISEQAFQKDLAEAVRPFAKGTISVVWNEAADGVLVSTDRAWDRTACVTPLKWVRVPAA